MTLILYSFRLSENHWFRNRKSVETWKLPRHLRHSRLYG